MQGPIAAAGGRRCLAAILLILASACGQVRNAEPGDTSTTPPPSAEAGREVNGDAGPPDADALLPPLAGYVVDDSAESGELRESFAHGSVPYLELRRRLILDDQGFTRGEVTVVTGRAETGIADRVLEHRFGDARRSPVQIGAARMLRIETEPHATLAWPGATFVVTFERGQAVDDPWLEELARTTVRTILETFPEIDDADALM